MSNDDVDAATDEVSGPEEGDAPEETASRRIEGQVAGILNNRELVINRGVRSGVEIGMRFAVLAPEGIGIKDPVTGESLGDVERPKILVKVTQVQDRMSVATTYRTKTVGGGFDVLRAAGGSFFAPRETVHEQLKADKDSYVRPLSRDDSIVALGDKVVEVVGEEFEHWRW